MSLPDLLREKPTIDQVEAWIYAQGGEAPTEPGGSVDSMPVTHRFTPGLYSREIFMPAGSFLSSKIHKTEHQYIVSRGKVSVYQEGQEPELIEAPFHGITKPGTRRLLYIHEDTVWTTFHPTNLKNLGKLEKRLIQPHANPLLASGECS